MHVSLCVCVCVCVCVCACMHVLLCVCFTVCLYVCHPCACLRVHSFSIWHTSTPISRVHVGLRPVPVNVTTCTMTAKIKGQPKEEKHSPKNNTIHSRALFFSLEAENHFNYLTDFFRHFGARTQLYLPDFWNPAFPHASLSLSLSHTHTHCYKHTHSALSTKY